MNTNTLQNYVSPMSAVQGTTAQVTGNIINVSTGQIVPGGRIQRHWEDKDVDYKKFFRSLPKNLSKSYMNDPATFVEYFKLHSVEFGNWLNQEERRQFLAAGADCLIQLADILGISHSSMGLNRKLSISFGARGVGGRYAAHYERKPYCIINITKPHATNGSFAHEFAHALDNLISFHVQKNEAGMISLDFVEGKNSKYTELMSKIFVKLLGKKMDSVWAEKLQEMTDYFNYPPEIFARTFEAVLHYEYGKTSNLMLYKNSYKDSIYPPESLLKAVSNDVLKFAKLAVNELKGIESFQSKAIKIDVKEEKSPEPIEVKKETPKVEKPIEVKKETPKVEGPKPVQEPKPVVYPQPFEIWEIKQQLQNNANVKRDFVDLITIKKVENNKIFYSTEKGGGGFLGFKSWENLFIHGLAKIVSDTKQPMTTEISSDKETTLYHNSDKYIAEIIVKYGADLYTLAGNKNADLRQQIFSKMTGKKTTKSQSGVNAIATFIRTNWEVPADLKTANTDADREERIMKYAHKVLNETKKAKNEAEYKESDDKPQTSNPETLYGDKVTVVTPTQKLQARYAVVEIENVIQSNDPFTFSPNPMYPESCQTRDYRLVKGEQNKVIEYSAQFEPKHLINNSPDATTGSPIITDDGIVLGGNGRTMILKRVFVNFKEKYKSYVSMLKTVSSVMFGIDSDELSKFKSPVLVRILDEAPIAECSKYSNILNQSNAQVYDEFQEGLSIAKEILNNPYAYKNIALAIANQEAETVAEIFADKQLNAMIIDTLKSIKLINNANMDLYVDSKDYTITNRGRSILVNALLSSILPDKQLLTQADKYKNKLIATLPAWIQVNSLKNDFNIIPKFQKALRMEAQRKASKLPLRDFIAQISAFSEETDVITIELLKILEYTNLKKFREFAKYFSQRAMENDSDNVFGEVITPQDIIFKWIQGNEINGMSDLSGPISFNYHKAVKAQANYLFDGTPISVTILPDTVNIYRKSDKKQIGQIDLVIMKVVSNQFDMFGDADLSVHANKVDALLSYIKGLKPIKKEVVKQDTMFSAFDMPTRKERGAMTMFDKVLTENLSDITSQKYNTLSDTPAEIPETEYDFTDEMDEITNIDDAGKIPLKPLYLPFGKLQKLLTKINSPFQMLIWGTQGNGKSSFLLSCLDELSVNGNCLLILTEETQKDGRIGERAKRMGIIRGNKIEILEAQKLSEIIDALDSGKYKFVAIDSKDAFDDEAYLLETYRKYNEKGICFLTVSHSLKDGTSYTGNRKYAYLSNTEIHVNKDGIAHVLKHRDAPKGNSIPIFSQIRKRNLFNL